MASPQKQEIVSCRHCDPCRYCYEPVQHTCGGKNGTCDEKCCCRCERGRCYFCEETKWGSHIRNVVLPWWEDSAWYRNQETFVCNDCLWSHEIAYCSLCHNLTHVTRHPVTQAIFCLHCFERTVDTSTYVIQSQDGKMTSVTALTLDHDHVHIHYHIEHPCYKKGRSHSGRCYSFVDEDGQSLASCYFEHVPHYVEQGDPDRDVERNLPVLIQHHFWNKLW